MIITETRRAPRLLPHEAPPTRLLPTRLRPTRLLPARLRPREAPPSCHLSFSTPRTWPATCLPSVPLTSESYLLSLALIPHIRLVAQLDRSVPGMYPTSAASYPSHGRRPGLSRHPVSPPQRPLPRPRGSALVSAGLLPTQQPPTPAEDVICLRTSL